MILRVFGSRYCDTCDHFCKTISDVGLKYKWIDADDEDEEELCDEQNVDYLPHVQIVDGKEVVFNHVGPMSADDLMIIFKRMVKRKQIREE